MSPLSLVPCVRGCGGYRIGPSVHIGGCPNRGKHTPASLENEIKRANEDIAFRQDDLNNAIRSRDAYAALLATVPR